MKKLIAIVLLLVVIFTLTGCDKYITYDENALKGVTICVPEGYVFDEMKGYTFTQNGDSLEFSMWFVKEEE